jgi:hypothetical protein
MFKRKTSALAAASALILSGCASTAWQPPAHHPADPATAPGYTQPLTALERYRAGTTTPEPAEPPAGATEHEGHEDMQHHHRGDQGEEAQ